MMTDEQDEARRELLHLLKHGGTVYCILRSVARSGLSRRIDFFCVWEGEIRLITWHMQVLAGQRNTGKGMQVIGCGLDLGAMAVNDLSRMLWPNAERGTLKTRWL